MIGATSLVNEFAQTNEETDDGLSLDHKPTQSTFWGGCKRDIVTCASHFKRLFAIYDADWGPQPRAFNITTGMDTYQTYLEEELEYSIDILIDHTRFEPQYQSLDSFHPTSMPVELKRKLNIRGTSLSSDKEILEMRQNVSESTQDIIQKFADPNDDIYVGNFPFKVENGM